LRRPQYSQQRAIPGQYTLNYVIKDHTDVHIQHWQYSELISVRSVKGSQRQGHMTDNKPSMTLPFTTRNSPYAAINNSGAYFFMECVLLLSGLMLGLSMLRPMCCGGHLSPGLGGQ
jgi:hypothetical protein